MGTVYLSWLATTTSNVLAQRASKRKKSVGGAFDVSGFSPSNDIPASIISATTTVVDNNVYEFKIENICTTGGPTINDNGLVEQIKFACILPSIAPASTSVYVEIPLTGTDITKARIILKKQSDNSTVNSFTGTRVGNIVSHTFSTLTASTGYYISIELYAVVDSVEVISSSVDYLNAVCGGNVTGYQFTTADPTVGCTKYSNGNYPEAIPVTYTDCSTGIHHVDAMIAPGQQICIVDGTLSSAYGLTHISTCIGF